MHRLQSIQALRGLAALGVVLTHSYLFFRGWAGVDLFFCLSGYLIATLHADDVGLPGKARPFALKRFVRIYPPLLAAVACWIAWHLFQGWRGAGWGAEELDGRPFWKGLPPTLLMYPTVFAYQRAIVVSWTLAYEALFYFLFFVAILGGKRFSRVLFWGWLALIVGFNLTHASPRSNWDAFFSPCILEFLCGVAASRLPHQRFPIPLFLLALALIAAGMATGVFTTAFFPYGHFFLFSKAYLGLSFSLLILACVGIENRFSLAIPLLLVALGDASYSIYLVHSFAVEGIFSLPHGGLPQVLCGIPLSKGIEVAALVCGVAAGLLFYRWVEKPLLGWCRRKWLPARS